MTMRRLTTVLAALAILTAACGDDDDAADDTGADEEQTQTDGAPSMGPAELEVEDQSGDGSEVVVASVTLPADGFIAVHADADGSPGPVIGHSELLPSGESTEVTVVLDEPLGSSATVWPMAHIDTNQNGEYDFDPPDVTDDGPATLDGGDVATSPLELTVEGGDDGDDAVGDGASVTIVDFSFDPQAVEVAAGSTATWANDDGVAHTVTAGSPGSPTGEFDEPVDAGATVEVSFDEAGTVDYFCAIHPAMTGQVVVS
jgi:plastocyanin